MGFFVLRPAGADRPAFDSLVEAAGRNGFALAENRATDAGHLALFANLSGSDPQSIKLDGDDFAVSYGSFLYRGAAGPRGLAALQRDFHPDSFGWDGLIGHHVVLLGKAGRIYLLGDGLGAGRIFANRDRSVLSNSFIALAWLGCGDGFDLQRCYEYVFAGSCYGTATLASGIASLAHNTIGVWQHGRAATVARPSPITQRDWPASVSLEEAASSLVARLDATFAPVAAAYGGRLRLSFSGGYDSRLILATFLKLGVKPVLFSYGAAGDDDVRIARDIAKAEGLGFDHIDKSTHPVPPPDAFAAAAEADLFAFDGWKSDEGVFSSGADRADRLSRHRGGQVPVNGSLGEIYRNFFYLPDRPLSAEDIVSSFYSQYDPAVGGALFDERAYRANLAEAIVGAIGAPSHRLARYQVEEAYPQFRGRYWSGHDGRINQRFGAMWFPFLEHALIGDTAKIPFRYKNLGVLQGAMIRRQNPRLAQYASSYGYPLGGERPLKARLLAGFTNHRPLALRRLSWRLKHRHDEVLPVTLSDAYLARVIDLDFPYTRRMFRRERIHDASVYNRVATLEYLGQKFNWALPDAILTRD